MGKMDATRQCVALELKLQVLKSSSSKKFATKMIVNVTINDILVEDFDGHNGDEVLDLWERDHEKPEQRCKDTLTRVILTA